MSIIERSSPPPEPNSGTPAGSDRLRVVTAGRVGHMEARLGTSGFDVVAVAETEADLLIAVSADEPDAIVVEADLCGSLEHVRELAPDAVLIVVGDHTPAGAIGRIERGVSGTVMAGLLHALVAEGVGAAVVWGLVPTLEPPGPTVYPVHGSLMSAKAQVVADHLVGLVRDHAGPVAAASTIVVTAAATVVLTLDAPRTNERADRPAAEPVVVSPAPQDPAVSFPPAPPTESHAGPTTEGASDVDGSRPGPATGPRGHGATPAKGREPPRGSPPPDVSPPHDVPPHPHGGPPPQGPPPSGDASRPPGVAKGWDEQRPPKKDDNGGHYGWSNNSVPDDRPPDQASTGASDETPGQSGEDHGASTEDHGASTEDHAG